MLLAFRVFFSVKSVCFLSVPYVPSLLLLKLESEDCPKGCLSCPGGNEALGLTCDLISGFSAGSGTIACERGDDW